MQILLMGFRMRERLGYRWVIATVLFVAYSIQYLDRVTASVLMPSISRDIGLSTHDIGTAAFLMLLFYGPSQYLSGVLTDRIGAKRLLVFSVVAWSVMAAWMGFLHSRTEYFERMALFGVMVGTEYIPSARILMRWFNKQGRARAQALLSWGWILTPAWASVFATQLAGHFGNWRHVFFVTAALGVIPLSIISLFVFDRPEQFRGITPEELESAYADEIESGTLVKGGCHEAQTVMQGSPQHGVSDFLKSPTYIAVVIVDIVMQVVLYGALTWIPLYLFNVFGFRLQQMGLWSGCYFMAGAAGSYLSSHLSDSLFRGNRRVMILACFIGLAPFVVLLATLHRADRSLLAVALCGMGFFGNMAWGPFLAVPAEIFSPEVYGKAMGLANGIGYTVAAFSAKIFAALVSTKQGAQDYSRGWYFIFACVVAGIIAATFIRPGEQNGDLHVGSR